MEIQNQNINNEFDEEISINIKKIFMTIWSRKFLLINIFFIVLLFFVSLTFILPKKYVVTADLYINKSNNSNMVELNPYVISELGASGGMAALMSGGGNLANELELIQSSLVIDKVVRENNIVYTKKFGILPNKKEGEFLSTKDFLKKNISFDNKKGTNLLSIKYKSKEPAVAFGVVSSIINNYVALHKQLNAEKSQSDKQIIEKAYASAKKGLDDKVRKVSGMPSNALTNTGNIAMMGAFSNSASKAIGTIQNQYIQGTKSEIEVKEEAAKLAELSKKLEWAKLVAEMSDSSKVLVLKEPIQPRDFEKASPKLFTNILLGIVFGFIIAIFVLIYKEITDKKLSLSMLSENIIYDISTDISELKLFLLTKQNKQIAFVPFVQIPNFVIEQLQEFNNLKIIQPELSNSFVNRLQSASEVVLLSSISKTDSKKYKQIRRILSDIKKPVLVDVLL